MQPDEQLIRACLSGDRASQRELYDRFCRKMFVVCSRYARSNEEAEDILQEGFVKVFKGLIGFKKESSLSTWITRIMINTALNHHRQKLYLYPMVDVEELDLTMVDPSRIDALALDDLIKLVQELPDGCRVVFNLFAMEGFSHKEISAQLGISEGTSKSQYNRARNLLQSKINSRSKDYDHLGKKSI